jgi:hypothetical protein
VWFLLADAMYMSPFHHDLKLLLFLTYLYIFCELRGGHFGLKWSCFFTVVICWLILFQRCDLFLELYMFYQQNGSKSDTYFVAFTFATVLLADEVLRIIRSIYSRTWNSKLDRHSYSGRSYCVVWLQFLSA